MTFSPMISGTAPHHGKYSSRKGHKISRVIFHHWAGTRGGDTRLKDPGQAASCTYLIYSDGSIVGQVPEEYRPWTSGGSPDLPSITFEIQNETGSPSWRISEKAMDSAVKLLADVASRYGWGGVGVQNVRGHREFASTSCPGPYVFPRLGDIRAKADRLVRGGKTPTVPPAKVSSKTTRELANEVIAGVWGVGEDRRQRLGARYNEVQAEVNRLLSKNIVPSVPKVKSISQLAQEVIDGKHGVGEARRRSLGARYNEVQAEVNRRLGLQTKTGTPAVDIKRLARAVLQGKYGNGATRKKLLGANYEAVQREVNRMLR